jgi:hypothetical protein
VALAAALYRAGKLVGVGIAARPRTTARQPRESPRLLEITHLCLVAGVPNGSSRLLGALKRAGKALGYQKAVTYTFAGEPGVSPRAAGFLPVVSPPEASRGAAVRDEQGSTPDAQRIRWEVVL